MRALPFVSLLAFASLAACSSSVAEVDGGGDASHGDVSDAHANDGAPSDVARTDALDVTATDATDVTGIDVPLRDVPIDRGSIDVTNDAPISCGMSSCAGGQVCCAMVSGGTAMFSCMDSCPDASIPISCLGPENCSGNPCCASISSSGMSGSVMCTSSPDACIPMFDIGMRTGQTRLCHTDSDCAPSTQLPDCCTLMNGGVTEHVCFNRSFASFIGATCP